MLGYPRNPYSLQLGPRVLMYNVLEIEIECCTHSVDKLLVLYWQTVAISVLLLFLLLKKVSSARLGESDIHPISPKTPAPQYQPIDRKKRKEKRVEDYSRDRAA